MSSRPASTISERRSQYPLHERLIVYNSESMQRMIDNKTSSPIPLTNPTASTFMVNGVNILNKNSLDSDTVMHRIMQRRQTHNRVERRRRDRMNSLFNNLSKCLPALQHKTENNRADILQEAIEHIKQLTTENHRLKRRGSFSQVPNLYEDDSASVTSSSGSENNDIVCKSSSHMSSLPQLPSISSLTSTPPDHLEQKRKPTMIRPQSQFEFILSFP
ncbi:helix-loop-helix DNA-binding domain-containing transcription factor [Mucor lusitanicus]|uniref:Helix-loop-helix DNA-binding domain-containing transcription factor n=2 Tax=Mucor circinelloides f. lusitanicus TaxID=29924 RepID=A0A168NFP4_MUCCL|nr:helix-loop-helix DNA-binding domain-containing transcription factor [Mucor lusitanicus]OAD06213.1 helix-loop-helix DNA-binding domain-containing transcription factor [Mucor lusitanicus CBS 277.49]